MKKMGRLIEPALVFWSDREDRPEFGEHLAAARLARVCNRNPPCQRRYSTKEPARIGSNSLYRNAVLMQFLR
jgi:hypothetical protein